MPEGPEVKSMVLQLNKFLKGKTLHQIVIHSGRYSKKSPDNFNDFIQTLPIKIMEVRNKGKFIWFQFEGGWTMWNTLGMTGGWNLTKSKHSHCEFILDGGESHGSMICEILGQLNFVVMKRNLKEDK